MSPGRWVVLVLATVAIPLAVVDTLWALDDVPGNTISEVVLPWAMGNPFPVFVAGLAFGTIFGHVLWGQKVYVPKVTLDLGESE